MATATTDRVYNFSAGPGCLPLPVLEEAQRHLLCLPGAGASILEISHRSAPFETILAEAEANIRKLLNVPDSYYVLFLQGGATTQFSMVPMNLMQNKVADYVQCGAWASKAIAEAKKVGQVNVIWNGKGEKYTRMPAVDELKPTPGADYLHITTNETIEGIEFADDPALSNVTLVADASSDILSRPMDVSKYGLIYAGAQKNMGPAGVTLVIARKDLVDARSDNLPVMLDYKIHAENSSMYNTPPVFSIYIVNLVARWLLNDIGGLENMNSRNRAKAKMIYDAIDRSNGYYAGHAKPDSRSIMNVTFRLPNEELEKKFARESPARQLDGLKGHRSVGGMRASIYNAFPIEGVERLVDFMEEFRKQNG